MPRAPERARPIITPETTRQTSEWSYTDETRRINTGYTPSALLFAPDGAIISGYKAKEIDWWDPQFGEKVRQISMPSSVQAMAAYKEEQLLIARSDGLCSILDGETGEEVDRSSRALRAEITSVGALPNGVVLSRTADNLIHAWMPKSGREGRLTEAAGARGMLILPGGITVFPCNEGSTLVYDMSRPAGERMVEGTISSKYTRPFLRQQITSAARISSGGLALGDTYGVLHIMNSHDVRRSPRLQIKAQDGPLDSVVVARDGAVITASSTKASITAWDIINRRSIRTLSGHEGGVSVLAIDSAGHLFSGGADGTIKQWGRREQSEDQG